MVLKVDLTGRETQKQRDQSYGYQETVFLAERRASANAAGRGQRGWDTAYEAEQVRVTGARLYRTV